eukprot:tig00020904_g15147.t1
MWGAAKEHLLCGLKRDSTDVDARAALLECLVRLSEFRAARDEGEDVLRLLPVADARRNREPLQLQMAASTSDLQLRGAGPARRLRCGHEFHVDCIDGWARSDFSDGCCPICRAPLDGPPVASASLAAPFSQSASSSSAHASATASSSPASSIPATSPPAAASPTFTSNAAPIDPSHDQLSVAASSSSAPAPIPASRPARPRPYQPPTGPRRPHDQPQPRLQGPPSTLSTDSGHSPAQAPATPTVVHVDRYSDANRDAREIASLRRRLAETQGLLAAAEQKGADLAAALEERDAQLERLQGQRDAELAAHEGRIKAKGKELAEQGAQLAFLQARARPDGPALSAALAAAELEQRESERRAAEVAKAALEARIGGLEEELSAAAGREAGLLVHLRCLQARTSL